MLLLIIILIILLIIYYYTYETFNNNNNLIDYYVINIATHQKRCDNIAKMSDIIGTKINIFEAIKGIDIKNVLDYDENINFTFKYNYINEVGCYLSHLLLIKSLMKSKYEYTVIFEDDFNIINDNFIEELNNIINNLKNTDFDIVFLGNNNDNYGSNYKDNIYNIDKNKIMWGTHAYLVNNKNINKIYTNLLLLDEPIDVKYKQLYNDNKLNNYVIYPIIVSIINDKSSIGDITVYYNK